MKLEDYKSATFRDADYIIDEACIEVDIYDSSVPEYYRNLAEQMINKFCEERQIELQPSDVILSGLKSYTFENEHVLVLFIENQEGDTIRLNEEIPIERDEHFAEFRKCILNALENIFFNIKRDGNTKKLEKD
jgi:hypothetical protein